jgi:hypothetical protein
MSSTAWAFGPAGQYTATWDGVGVVTVTVTSTGAFVTSFVAQSLTQAMASPELVNLLIPAQTPPVSLPLVATTGPAGFTLVNGTPNILSWTTPADGNMHRAIVIAAVHVTSTETGGQLNTTGNAADGTAFNQLLIAGGAATGAINRTQSSFLLQANTTLAVTQNTALTAGAAIAWAEIWGA